MKISSDSTFFKYEMKAKACFICNGYGSKYIVVLFAISGQSSEETALL
jgi:hypothetical protein